MEFIKRMKKREFIEMALKTLASLLACVLAVLLLEGMIYAIKMDSLVNKGMSASSYSDSTIAYCVERDNGRYAVIYYNEGDDVEWSCSSSDLKTKEQCDSTLNAVKVIYGQPSPFDLSMNFIHYILMVVLVVAVSGFFVYSFIRLGKEYKLIEKEFKETGKVGMYLN